MFHQLQLQRLIQFEQKHSQTLQNAMISTEQTSKQNVINPPQTKLLN